MQGEPRLCGCSCGERLDDGRSAKAKYVNERHRQRAYRRRVKEEARRRGVEPSLTLETLRATDRAGVRNGDAQTARGRRKRGPLPGVRVYFQPGEAEALLEALDGAGSWNGSAATIERARDAVRAALDRRLERLTK
jgi:hypothetical protein